MRLGLRDSRTAELNGLLLGFQKDQCREGVVLPPAVFSDKEDEFPS